MEAVARKEELEAKKRSYDRRKTRNFSRLRTMKVLWTVGYQSTMNVNPCNKPTVGYALPLDRKWRNPVEFSRGGEKPQITSTPTDQTQGLMLQLLQTQLLLLNKPQPTDSSKFLARQSHAKDLPYFSGRPEEWPAFLADFERTTRVCGFSDDENMSRLRKCLKGEAAATVQCLMISPDNLVKVMDTLRLRFGRSEHIIEAMIAKVQKTNPVKEDRLETILDFGSAVGNLTTIIKSLDCHAHLCNPMLLKDLEAKLSASYKMQWASWLTANPSRDRNLEYFTEWVEQMVRFACAFCPPKSFDVPQDNRQFGRFPPNRRQENIHVVEDPMDQRSIDTCSSCDIPGHLITTCRKFQAKSLDDRRKLARDKRLCYSCLMSGHNSSDCSKKKNCNINECQQHHHPLLHPNQAGAGAGFRRGNTRHTPRNVVRQHLPGFFPEESFAQQDEVIHTVGNSCTRSIMSVLPVRVKGPLGEEEVYAFLDNGSSTSLMDASLAVKLGLTGTSEPFCMGTLTSQEWQPNSKKVSLQIQGTTGIPRYFPMNDVRTLDKLPLKRMTQNVDEIREKYPFLKCAELPTFHDIIPKLLIGISHCFLTTPLQHISNSIEEPIAFKSRLGWCIGGPQRGLRNRVDETYVYHTLNEVMDETLQQMVKSSFSTEDFGVKITHDKPRSKEDIRAVEIMELTTKRVDDGKRFETGLLWRSDNPVMPESKANAFHRLRCQEKNMDKDANFALRYCQKMDEYLQKGFIRKLSQAEVTVRDPKQWYLPHFGVINPNKPEKLRLIFDAKAKAGGTSLNDSLIQGPDLNNPLVAVLWKFRQYKVAFVGDIKDMFHRVKIRNADLPAQRFLWRGMERMKPPDVYEIVVMIFGATCSPCSAQYAKNINAAEHAEDFPEAASAIKEKFYVDDYLDSTPDDDGGIRRVKNVIDINRDASLETCNWVSNSRKLLETLPVEMRAKDVQDLELEKGENKVGRILGLWWNCSSDEFTFKLNFHKVPEEILKGLRRPTKREVLRLLMSIYDTLGFVAHLVIKAKILLQDIWKTGIGWDDALTDDLDVRWKSWLEELSGITGVKIPRCYSTGIPQSSNIQLHVFCDASQKAFACAAFLRVETDEEVDISLVAAKTRVAPLKLMSIPRLELQAAVMGSRLAKSIKDEHEISIHSTHYWTDSKTVVCWIRNTSRRFKQFVSHRIGEIAENTDVLEWHWVPTDLNVADDATRDTSPADLSVTSRWFTGPPFLRLDQSEWPKEKHDSYNPAEEENLEIINILENVEPVINAGCFSKLERLLRVTSWILRFQSNLKRRITKKSTEEVSVSFLRSCKKLSAVPKAVPEPLKVLELQKAKLFWCKIVQIASFSLDIAELNGEKQVCRRSRLWKLNTFVGLYGLLQVGGRLGKARRMADLVKHPIILDSKHPFTKLLVDYYHRLAGHQGRELVANELRQKFWILGVTGAVKEATRNCMACKLRKASPIIPEMGELPSVRMESRIHPFENCGMDYFGPFMVKVGRRREKRWGVLFTCFSTRAVHLELASSLSTDSAIMAVRRMISRRGSPRKLYSDNGTNFRGASNELKLALAELDRKKMDENLSIGGIQWIFNPPAAPHMGGVWERLIRSVKTILQTILREQEPKEETLHTFLLEVENIINSRPLTHVSVDHEDEECLTPNHFILGWSSGKRDHGPEVLAEGAPGVFDDVDLCLRKEWRISQRLADIFWRRWVKEYLPTLTKRVKWCKRSGTLNVGDLVIIADDQAIRNHWQKGIVDKVFPGKDEDVRVVDVRTSSGIFRRPVHKICVLDLQSTLDAEVALPASEGSNVRGFPAQAGSVTTAT